jgi:predicted enzyme related to lactoylglutathione lyase
VANYKQGEICWYELGTRDIKAAVDFYKKLTGWTTVEHDMGEMGIYYIFQLDGQDVGAAYQMGGPQFEGVPPHWMTYVWVDDVDAVAAKAAQLGGKIIAPPMDVADVGRMAFVQDPQGANFAIFKGREHHGAARLSGKSGSFLWIELTTSDVQGARSFYGGAVGWTYKDLQGPGGGYTICEVDGKGVAGMTSPKMPGAPPHWMPYLSIADCDKSVARAQQSGAAVIVPPQDVPAAGRLAVLRDPTGAVFAVLAPRPM